MKRIKVIVQAAYQFNDFRWITERDIVLLAEKGIDLQIVGTGEGPDRVRGETAINILVVDWWEHKAPENTASLCRQLHPNVKIVMIDSHWSMMNDEEKAKINERYDYYCYVSPLAEPVPMGCLRDILRNCGFEEFAYRLE